MRRGLTIAVVLMAAAGAWLWLGGASTVFHANRTASNLVLITIDTLRADSVGAYGHSAARTPQLDRLAREGARFTRAFATAPVTLPSHASLLSGLYPPGHGARHNGIPARSDVETLATVLSAAGFQTGAFVAAFPLDQRFGLARGFGVYDDALGHGPDGRQLDERPGAVVVDAARQWLERRAPGRFFLWVHLFEPHAPYGQPGSGAGRSVRDRYDDDVAEADAQVGRLLERLGPGDDTLVVVAADHGEAFGEHDELAHSVFVYDTTLRVPLIMRGPGVVAGGEVDAPVSLVDIMPTALARLGLAARQTDGLDLTPALAGRTVPGRALYAETFAPLIDFGWASLRSIRRDQWKFIAAPQPELYDTASDPAETTNVVEAHDDVARELERLVAERSGPELAAQAQAQAPDPEAVRRLGALGYVGGGPSRVATARPDPKDRRAEARRFAEVTSGELQGDALVDALRAIVADDAANPQANLRLGFALLARGDCEGAAPRFDVAIRAALPSADSYLGRASCEMAAGRLDDARATLERADVVEPGNAVVEANLGLVESAAGRQDAAVRWLTRAVTTDPNFHEARFNLALAHARAGDRSAALREARELLNRLAPTAPQRTEVTRLIASLSGSGG